MYAYPWKIAFTQLFVFDDLEVPTHKTKHIVNYFKQMEDTKKLLLVDGGSIDEKLKLATQNLHYVNVLPSIVSFSFILASSIIVWIEVKKYNCTFYISKVYKYASMSQYIYNNHQTLSH